MKFVPAFALLLASVANAVEFVFQINAGFENNVAIECDEKSEMMISEMMRSHLQIDVIASRTYDDIIPELILSYEKFGSGDMLIDHIGDLFTLPTDTELLDHLTTQDLLLDLLYDATVPAVNETLNSRRRLEMLSALLADQEAKKDEQQRLRGRRQEVVDTEGSSDGRVPVGGGDRDGDDGWRPVKRHLLTEQGHRHLGFCDGWNRGNCPPDHFCWRYCGFGGRRRRRLDDRSMATGVPSEAPSETPSASPSQKPSSAPSLAPSEGPSPKPSMAPSISPSASPSSGHPSEAPSPSPSAGPSSVPSLSPSFAPSASPSSSPSSEHPSIAPSISPSSSPSSGHPSEAPSPSPSAGPSSEPSASPSSSPSSEHPSIAPSISPSQSPSSGHPSEAPSPGPSSVPSVAPSSLPSLSPSASPSDSPVTPTEPPTAGPTVTPEHIKCIAAVQAMESRVSKFIEEKLRFLARQEICPCLGKYWELEVVFETDLEDYCGDGTEDTQ